MKLTGRVDGVNPYSYTNYQTGVRVAFRITCITGFDAAMLDKLRAWMEVLTDVTLEVEPVPSVGLDSRCLGCRLLVMKETAGQGAKDEQVQEHLHHHRP